MSIKLYNQGKRKITFDMSAAPFCPGQTMEFDDLLGARLRSLFPTELLDIDAATVKFKTVTAPAPAVDALAVPAAIKVPVVGETTAVPAVSDDEIMKQLEAEEAEKAEAERAALGL
jgi:hypothetical protein